MTASSLRREVERLVTALLRANLAIEAQAVISTSSGNRQAISWGGGRGSSISSEIPSATIAEYRRLLRDGEYSCVLTDGSLLQLSFVLERESIVKHRMVYFPCPLVFEKDELDVVGELSFTELFELALSEEFALDSDAMDPDSYPDIGRLRLRAPLRFDFDLEAMRVGHPGSHLHLSDESVRWAIFGPLSVGHFVRFVFRHFYPSVWAENEFLRTWPTPLGSRCVSVDEEKELFIDCRAQDPHRVVA
jgi:hypothetical protein